MLETLKWRLTSLCLFDFWFVQIEDFFLCVCFWAQTLLKTWHFLFLFLNKFITKISRIFIRNIATHIVCFNIDEVLSSLLLRQHYIILLAKKCLFDQIKSLIKIPPFFLDGFCVVFFFFIIIFFFDIPLFFSFLFSFILVTLFCYGVCVFVLYQSFSQIFLAFSVFLVSQNLKSCSRVSL